VQVQDLAGIHPQGKQNIYVPSKKKQSIYDHQKRTRTKKYGSLKQAE
jgi:hypothetical protein